MADFSYILNILLHNANTANLKFFFIQRFNIKIIDYNLINKFVLYKFNQYATLNTEDYYL